MPVQDISILPAGLSTDEEVLGTPRDQVLHSSKKEETLSENILRSPTASYGLATTEPPQETTMHRIQIGVAKNLLAELTTEGGTTHELGMGNAPEKGLSTFVEGPTYDGCSPGAVDATAEATVNLNEFHIALTGLTEENNQDLVVSWAREDWAREDVRKISSTVDMSDIWWSDAPQERVAPYQPFLASEQDDAKSPMNP